MCGLPGGPEMIMNHGVGQPGIPIFRANGEEDNRRLAGIDTNAARRTFASDVFVGKIAGRVEEMSKKFVMSTLRWGETLSSRDFF